MFNGNKKLDIKPIISNKEFQKWVMEKWIHNEKNINKSWYNPNITSNKLIHYIETNKSFPYSITQLADIWISAKYIRKSIKNKKLSGFYEQITVNNTKSSNEYPTLRINEKTNNEEFFEEFGIMSRQAIYDIQKSAKDKSILIFNSLFGENTSLSQREKNQKLRTTTENLLVDKFINILFLYNGSGMINKFIVHLVNDKILTENEVKIISKKEKLAYFMLRKMEKDVARQVLLEDINESDNVFKSFQTALSKHFFELLLQDEENNYELIRGIESQ